MVIILIINFLDAGRLLLCGGAEEWAHVNCALWSVEVYEDTNGYLCSVCTAIGRGLRLVREGERGDRKLKNGGQHLLDICISYLICILCISGQITTST